MHDELTPFLLQAEIAIVVTNHRVHPVGNQTLPIVGF